MSERSKISTTALREPVVEEKTKPLIEKKHEISNGNQISSDKISDKKTSTENGTKQPQDEIAKLQAPSLNIVEKDKLDEFFGSDEEDDS